MKTKKIILLILYILIMIITLCGCNNKKEDNIIDDKINSEIQYLDKRIIGIMNKLNNITLENYEVKSKETSLQSGGESSGGQGEGKNDNSSSEENGESGGTSDGGGASNNKNSSSNIKVLQMQPSNILVTDKNDIDWLTIKSEIEVMYSAWNSILIDLYDINVNNEDILSFSKALDDTVLAAKEENKSKTLETLANLYSYLPKYMEKLSVDEATKNTLQIKFYILNAYALLEQDNWVEVQNQINQADESYTKLISDVKYIEDKQGEVSRVYVLIKELENSINSQDKDIFYIKYKNLMNSIQ